MRLTHMAAISTFNEWLWLVVVRPLSRNGERGDRMTAAAEFELNS
jgi:hypothetical protein